MLPAQLVEGLVNQAVDNLGNNQLTSINVLNTTYAYTVFMRADIAISEGEPSPIWVTLHTGVMQSEHLNITEGYAEGLAYVTNLMLIMASFQRWTCGCIIACG